MQQKQAVRGGQQHTLAAGLLACPSQHPTRLVQHLGIRADNHTAALGQAEHSRPVHWQSGAREVHKHLEVGEGEGGVPARGVVEAAAEDHGAGTGAVDGASFQEGRDFVFVGRNLSQELHGGAAGQNEGVDRREVAGMHLGQVNAIIGQKVLPGEGKGCDSVTLALASPRKYSNAATIDFVNENPIELRALFRVTTGLGFRV